MTLMTLKVNRVKSAYKERTNSIVINHSEGVHEQWGTLNIYDI